MRRKINLNQLTLPFGERRTRAISYEDRQRFFWFMAGLSLLSLGVYFYAINATARNIALRANLENRVTEAENSLSGLEFHYIELKNSVSMELAYQYGFQEVQNPLYISRGRENALTLNTVNR